MREATRARPTPRPRARDAAQRTVVTVLKADISGSTLLGERLDPGLLEERVISLPLH